jgi:predicted aspartyl protease
LSRIEFKYQKESSNIFASIKRPRVTLQVFSRVFREWIVVEDVLADTGADISIIPKTLGIILVGEITNRRRYKIQGMVSSAFMYLHRLKVRLDGKELSATFAIANSDNVPPTLGRKQGLDKFKVVFDRGQKLRFS